MKNWLSYSQGCLLLWLPSPLSDSVLLGVIYSCQALTIQDEIFQA